MKMLRLLSCISVCAVILFVSLSRAWCQVAVSEPSGFFRIYIPSNNTSFLTLPMEVSGSDLLEQLNGQLVGEVDQEVADGIIFWDQNNQEYDAYYKADNTGREEYNGRWFELDSGTNWIECTNSLNPGEGFWLVNNHSDIELFVSGWSLMDSTFDTVLKPGLNTIGFPYLFSLCPDAAGFAASGAYAGTNQDTSDVLIYVDSTNWLLAAYPENTWQSSTGGSATTCWNITSAAWYQNKSTNDFIWTASRPYADLFSSASNAPQIASIEETSTTHSVVITIQTTGGTDEVVEVFYQDVAVAGCLDHANWAVAAQGLSDSGDYLVWEDAGDIERTPPSNVFSRLYVAARQDQDSDGDGISDARELLVPSFSDTDNDGMADTWETNYFGGLSQSAEGDNDGDGISNRDEYRRGTDPTDSSSTRITFFVNAASGREAYDGLTRLVTALHGPKAAIQSTASAAETNDRIEIASGSYAESGLSNSVVRVVLVPVGTVQITP
ncbi:MAG: hypothetical protein PHP44_14820 [Kiritimatiellae bacterium]|nr:hypothetical protein [Kiritimatiellia bacterium]